MKQPIQFQYDDDGEWSDYTLYVNEPATPLSAIAAELDDLTFADDAVYVGFEQPMAGIRITMLSGSTNDLEAQLVVKYWDGIPGKQYQILMTVQQQVPARLQYH